MGFDWRAFLCPPLCVAARWKMTEAILSLHGKMLQLHSRTQWFFPPHKLRKFELIHFVHYLRDTIHAWLRCNSRGILAVTVLPQLRRWFKQDEKFLELFRNLAGTTQMWLCFHPSERKCSVLRACSEYFCCFILQSWGVLFSLPPGSLLSKLLFFTSLPKENISLFTDNHISLGRNEFNKDEELKTGEMIKLLRQGQRSDQLSFSHSHISHITASPVVCWELRADGSTSINLLCSSFPPSQKHLHQGDVRP